MFSNLFYIYTYTTKKHHKEALDENYAKHCDIQLIEAFCRNT